MPNSKNRCFICESQSNSKEHIIPQWLQRYFKLPDQKLGLWNDTALLYKQAVVPLCKKCNENLLSRLEIKVQSGSATDMEYYLWALKIRFLLSIKDSTIYFDRSDPSKGKLLNSEQASIGHDFIKHALNNFEREEFKFYPDPFGSVIILDNPLKDDNFGLIDTPHPHWALAISLPPHKILLVLFTDRGLVNKALSHDYNDTGGLQAFCEKLPAASTNELLRQLVLKLLLKQYQISNIPYGVSWDDSGIVSNKIPDTIEYRKKLKQSVLKEISHFLKLGDQFAIELYNSLPSNYRD